MYFGGIQLSNFLIRMKAAEDLVKSTKETRNNKVYKRVRTIRKYRSSIKSDLG